MVRTQIQLTDKQFALSKQLAAQQHISMAELIRQGLDRLLNAEIAVTHEEWLERAMRAAGRFHSGVRNISVEHDRYLADSFS